MGHPSQHPQHAAEQGHRDANPVLRCEVLVFADPVAVVADVVVGQHDALGESGGARGVLHVHHVVGTEVCLARPVGRIVHHGAHRQDLGDGAHAPVLLGAQESDAFEMRIGWAAQAIARLGFELRHAFVEGLNVIDVAEAVDQEIPIGIAA